MKLLFPSLGRGPLFRHLYSTRAQRARNQQRLLRRGLQNSPRTYRVSTSRRDSTAQELQQVQPLSGFYEDLLTAPVPQAVRSRKSNESKDESSGPKIFYGAERKYRGGISDTPDSTWRTVNGVPVPPRPEEPDNCCMSGCVHCVWDDYRDEVERWAVRLRQAQARAHGMGMDGSPKVGMSRPELADASASMDDDGGGSEALWDSASTVTPGEDLFRDIPVGIREFMATEKRLRDRKKNRKVLENDYE
jgi:hypothetical protein